MAWWNRLSFQNIICNECFYRFRFCIRKMEMKHWNYIYNESYHLVHKTILIIFCNCSCSLTYIFFSYIHFAHTKYVLELVFVFFHMYYILNKVYLGGFWVALINGNKYISNYSKLDWLDKFKASNEWLAHWLYKRKETLSTRKIKIIHLILDSMALWVHLVG